MARAASMVERWNGSRNNPQAAGEQRLLEPLADRKCKPVVVVHEWGLARGLVDGPQPLGGGWSEHSDTDP